MNNSPLLHDPNIQRLVRDFDTLADFVQSLIDRDSRVARQVATPINEQEYTTEWQMEQCVAMAHAL